MTAGWPESIRKDNPYELAAETTWEIYDPVEARIIAYFHDETLAKEYAQWLNEKNSQ